MRRLLLVRHTETCPSFRGRCYGATDVPLSPAGLVALPGLAAQICAYGPCAVVHSGRARTRRLAEAISGMMPDLACTSDARLRELDFGSWEGRTWDDIHAEDSCAIDRLAQDPHFAPPGGETVQAMRARVMAWYESCEARGVVVAISHGGPIAALRGSLGRLPPEAWPKLIPAYGAITEVR